MLEDVSHLFINFHYNVYKSIYFSYFLAGQFTERRYKSNKFSFLVCEYFSD